MKPGPDPERNLNYRALLQLLRTADALWNASRRFFAQWNLSPSQFNILNLLRLVPEGLSQSDLSRELIMHRSNVTGLVDRLERRGLVQRLEVVSDRRAYTVRLTREGVRLLGEILPRYYQGANRACRHLSGRRAASFIADLREISGNAERFASKLPIPPANEE